eukprot:SAG11_NODE_770_length_7257_cov_2.448449_3_plen_52_part_00
MLKTPVLDEGHNNTLLHAGCEADCAECVRLIADCIYDTNLKKCAAPFASVP